MDQIQGFREMIASYGAEIYDRHLTDASGGNISVRVDDKIVMTPKKAGSVWHWKLRPQQVLILDLKGNKLEGEGEVSREVKVHLALLNEFYPEGTAVVHSHARNVLVFCAAEKPIPPVLYATSPFGVIEQCKDASSGTDDLARFVADKIREIGGVKTVKAAACMAPRHGLFVLAQNLYDAFDVTERIDTNAYCLLMGKTLGETVPLVSETKEHKEYEE
ncbi:MAG: class II aldolase/adducin family protein [Anaerolineaceae bacterium]|jgi:L-fuculose-phosphate aldolase